MRSSGVTGRLGKVWTGDVLLNVSVFDATPVRTVFYGPFFWLEVFVGEVWDRVFLLVTGILGESTPVRTCG